MQHLKIYVVFRSNDNWTLVYQGNQTEYQLTANLIKKSNLTFRLYVGNHYGRQENYSQVDIRIERKLFYSDEFLCFHSNFLFSYQLSQFI